LLLIGVDRLNEPVKVDDPIASAAKRWYGYGRWDAPFWFIGPEPGMGKDEGENLLARCRAWQALGGAEMLDCFEHHRELGHLKWHTRNLSRQGDSRRPPTQTTWRQLIRTLLAFKHLPHDNEAIGAYQCDSWGARDGETCLPELSALAARSFSVPRDRLSFRHMRAEHLREMVVEHEPRFVLMYGGGKDLQPHWNYIASGSDGDSPFADETISGRQVGFETSGATKFVRTLHPASAGGPAPPDAYWLEIAERLRSVCRP
jgi:hypothetical protein